MKANHIVFVENRNQAIWIKETNFYNPHMTLVALTADALQSLEEFHYPSYPISDITDTYALVEEEDKYIRELLKLTEEIETYIGQRYPSAQFEGPGFLSGNYYTLQYSISAIAKRGFLMREAIRFFSPNHVTAFQEEVHDWFVDDGYKTNPWDNILEIFSKEYNFDISFIEIKTKKAEAISPRYDVRLFYRKSINFITAKTKKIIDSIFILPKNLTLPEEYNGLKVLFVNSVSGEWKPVVKLFGSNKKIKSFELKPLRLKKNKWWSTIGGSSVTSIFSHDKYELNIEFPVFNPQESKDLIHLFEQWLKERQEPPKISVLGMNIFPFLIPQIRTMIIQGPEICRYSDKLAKSIQKNVQPHMACFFCITILSERRFAFQCEKSGIPVVCYQHGGIGYNIQIQPKNEGLDPAYADYVLSYGVETPRSNPVFPVKAKFIPVGSARIEKMVQNKKLFFPRTDKKLKTLWIAETSSENTYFATITEDTKRYKIQKACLNILSKSEKNHVIYRPPIPQLYHDGTSTWIKNENNSSISIDAYTPLEELIKMSDVVILDNSCLTTWVEVMRLNKPMILYYDLRQSPIAPDFIPDLESACCWCKSETQFVNAINRLVTEGDMFLEELKIDNSKFLEKYILQEGNCAMKVCSFLNSLRKNT